MKYAVFGVDGYIGSYIYRQLKKDGYDVIGTSRRDGTGDSLISYDILKDTVDDILVRMRGNDKTAIICIAESNIDRCRVNNTWAYDINVAKTQKLVEALSDQDFQIIYFSSDNVFDGVEGNYTEESLVNPVNKYGEMKAIMEQYLYQQIPKACILRISKVVSTQAAKQNVFTEWLNQTKKGLIKCIRGNRLSFICIDDIYQVCVTAAEKRMYGLYNIAGDDAYGRAALAEKFYQQLGITDIEVREYDWQEFGFKDKRPLDVSMCNQKFKDETGYQFMNMNDAIEKFIIQNGEWK